jgi:predicted nucleotidyltransferase
MVDENLNIISQFKTTIQQLYGERLSKIILFGSYARGEEKENSDMDFLIVLKDKNISVFNEIEKINNQVYDMILQTGKIISFIPTTEEKFERSPNYFYRLVKKEGKAV